ncbi:MAG: hypothetical protein Q8N08_07780 [Methanobacteriaceae archaeon]|nr:hypothetical protein [Methanobacteriaceae archaeon]
MVKEGLLIELKAGLKKLENVLLQECPKFSVDITLNMGDGKGYRLFSDQICSKRIFRFGIGDCCSKVDFMNLNMAEVFVENFDELVALAIEDHEMNRQKDEQLEEANLELIKSLNSKIEGIDGGEKDLPAWKLP